MSINSFLFYFEPLKNKNKIKNMKTIAEIQNHYADRIADNVTLLSHEFITSYFKDIDNLGLSEDVLSEELSLSDGLDIDDIIDDDSFQYHILSAGLLYELAYQQVMGRAMVDDDVYTSSEREFITEYRQHHNRIEYARDRERYDLFVDRSYISVDQSTGEFDIVCGIEGWDSDNAYPKLTEFLTKKYQSMDIPHVCRMAIINRIVTDLNER